MIVKNKIASQHKNSNRIANQLTILDSGTF